MQYIYDKDGVLTEAAFPVTPGFGVVVPANGIELEEALLTKVGYVWLYNNSEPVQVKDNRGTYYLKETGEAVDYAELGDIPDTLTNKASTSIYDVWDGKKWVKDEEKEEVFLAQQAIDKRNSYLGVAREKIAPLQDAIDLDMATDEEISLLKEWKKCRVLLNRIEQQAGFPNKIEWPAQPV